MQAQNWKWCCHIKLWIAFNIIFILVYCGLYTMTIDVVTWRIIKKLCIWSLHLRNFLWLSVFALFLQKICGSSRIFFNFIYKYIKLKLGTAKHICLKWVFLPQWPQGLGSTTRIFLFIQIWVIISKTGTAGLETFKKKFQQYDSLNSQKTKIVPFKKNFNRFWVIDKLCYQLIYTKLHGAKYQTRWPPLIYFS